MDEKSAKKIITNENLDVNWFNAHELRPYEMVISKVDGRYAVFGTDERAGVWGLITKFDDEEKALDDLIKKARIKI
ncbi:Imm59 family immunity protein [uncultured Lacticaseibacillus sp.]|uniref:Imm59 family immunity protein n=1 Tax=uncultured Lacticaseibacillus sp. TaxID=2775882 RepID=UPI0025925856|nr:Imm59 family immunity protein [uncultured Lacticaseibacillus sp.]